MNRNYVTNYDYVQKCILEFTTLTPEELENLALLRQEREKTLLRSIPLRGYRHNKKNVAQAIADGILSTIEIMEKFCVSRQYVCDVRKELLEKAKGKK